jgi:hypothetical protein
MELVITHQHLLETTSLATTIYTTPHRDNSTPHEMFQKTMTSTP